MTIVLKLYVTGKSVHGDKAIRNLNEVLKKELKKKYELKIVDVLKNPQLAENEKILATPVLEKKLPLPIRRIIGDLSNRERILIGLDIANE